MTRLGLITPVMALALGACAVGPDFVRPAPPTTAAYAAPEDAPAPSDQQVALGEKIAGDWWTAFQSPALDKLIRQALAENRDVAQAKARVAEAAEGLKAAEGARLPQASLDASVGRQKYGVSLFGPINISIPPYTYYTVGPVVTFPLDIFGGQKRNAEEKAAYLQYQGYELDAAYRSLSANVAAQAMAVAAAQAQIDALQAVVEGDEADVKLVQTALDAGSATRTQLLAAQAQLAADQTLAPELHQQQAQARHALAVLLGQAPADAALPELTLEDFTLPSTIPASLPSELVRRRPDILAAEAQLHVASAAIGVATANLYPQITLTGAASLQALQPGSLFNSSANAYAVAANLTQPIFDGGQLRAQRRAAVDRYQGAEAAYQQTVLTAFREVADGLQALADDADEVHDQQEAQRTAEAALDLARRSYGAGNSGVLDVIDAQRRVAQARMGLSRATAQRLVDTVRLYLALGGTPVGAETDAPGA